MEIPEHIKEISVDQFTYNLPDERIAKYPLADRDQSKLLVWRNSSISDEPFFKLAEHLPEKSLLVFNNTKVIRARLFFMKETGAKIEIFVLDPEQPVDYAQNFQQTHSCRWKCIVGNLKKWKSGKLSMSVEIGGISFNLFANNHIESGNGRIIEFIWDNPLFTFSEVLEAAGNIPIPPYLHRESEVSDLTRYQTVYSKIKGSVASPTAGLHFTDTIFDSLKNAGFQTAELTLHVGAGTFQPVKAETIAGHEMHTEHFLVHRSFIEKMIKNDGPVVAVGTTSVRTLESLYWLGLKICQQPGISLAELIIHQWEPYQNQPLVSRKEALFALIGYLDKHGLELLQSSTQIIILPGYSFQMIAGMVTNFHQPQSTLLLLISAFIGDSWKEVYNHAMANDYRFLSYGDSNLYLK